MKDLKGKDRLIVALDVPTGDEALRLVGELPNVTFFKVGLQLFLSGDLPRVLKHLNEKRLFVDLKVPGDISNTIHSVIDLCIFFKVQFLTLSTSVPNSTIKSALSARGKNENPKLLMVPYLSSLDEHDLAEVEPGFADKGTLDDYIRNKAATALDAGCDGLIASGCAISLLRQLRPQTLIVSPGIRPAGSSADDHKRFTTPTKAIHSGADYLVVGRPIRNADSPQKAAQQIIKEINVALGSSEQPTRGWQGMAAQPPVMAKGF